MDDLDFFEQFSQHMTQNGSLKKFQMNNEGLREKYNLTKELIESLCYNYSIYYIDWILINDAGCSTDDEESQLPHHKSATDEIKKSIKKLNVFLKNSRNNHIKLFFK